MWGWCDKTQKWPDSPKPLYTFETSGMCLMLSFCLFPLVTGKYFCAFESFSGQSGHVLKLYIASECFLWVCSQDDFCVSAKGYVWSWWSCKCFTLPMQPSYMSASISLLWRCDSGERGKHNFWWSSRCVSGRCLCRMVVLCPKSTSINIINLKFLPTVDQFFRC